MRLAHRLAMIAALLALPTGTTLWAAEESELIAVLDLVPVEARKAEASALTDRLREELLKTGYYTLVDRSQMDAVLEEQALQQTGCTEQECAVQVGQILGVRKMVAGKVTKLSADMWLVSAILVDVETAQTLRAESLRHRGDFFTLMDVAIADLAGNLSGAPPALAVSASAPQATIRTPQPGDTWRDPTTGMEFVQVPGGSFEMGCHANAGECESDERPTRTVRLDGFWLGKHEVTQAQWQRIMGNNPSEFQKGDNYPVEHVSWNDIQEFI